MYGSFYMEEIFNPVQQAALSLMQSDLRFLYTVFKKVKTDESNFIPSLFPYIGVIIDGIEDWIKSFNNSTKNKLVVPTFDTSAQKYYEKMRSSIKMWESDYCEIYESLETANNENDEYFGSLCKPIAKILKLYDIYGVDRANNIICGNTILCFYYNPLYTFGGKDNREYIKEMSKIIGDYIVIFYAEKEFLTDDKMIFDTKDYGGFQKSPAGNKFSDKFVLFSILCQINFLIYCVENWIKEEAPTKLRLLYLLYYSLLKIIPQINNKIHTTFTMNNNWNSDKFRNAMAHYKLGVVLKEEELIMNDAFYGLTQKFFGVPYFATKMAILTELKGLAYQIEQYLQLKL